MSTPAPPPEPASLSRKEQRHRRAIRLDPALWAGLDAFAKQERLSTNALLDAVVRRLLRGKGVELEDQEDDAGGVYKRISIRVKEADRIEVKEHAKAMGTTVTGWITAVVRSRIRKAPLLAVPETAALAEANKQLAAVGRNLNTVVHRLHREGRWAGNLDLYAELLASVKAVRARVEAVIAAGQARGDED